MSRQKTVLRIRYRHHMNIQTQRSGPNDCGAVLADAQEAYRLGTDV